MIFILRIINLFKKYNLLKKIFEHIDTIINKGHNVKINVFEIDNEKSH